MKLLRINSIYIGIIISILIHIALFGLIRRETPEGTPPEKYEVNLFYYFPVPQEVVRASEKPVIKKRSIKKLDHKPEKPPLPEEQTIELIEKEEEKIVDEHDVIHKELESETSGTSEEDKITRVEDLEVSDYSHGVSGGLEQEAGQAKVKTPAATSTYSPVDYSDVLATLRRRILSEKIYPPQARRRGIEGVVYLLVSLDLEGELIEARVIRSSGYRILDNAAVSLIKRVLPYEHGLGQPVTFEIPIRYELIDQDDQRNEQQE
ncbi:MAG: energy transducer TonB [Spirochaetota bacterium]